MALATVPFTSTPALKKCEFQKISQLAYQHFGLDLGADKESLVVSRLGRMLRELGLASFQDYYEYVQADRTGAALSAMVDHLTTNHTSFFREPTHFKFLRKTIFPTLLNRPQIHIWSAACATGEEPYSIAMSMLEESPRDTAAKVKIKATDISHRVLEKATQGVYSKDRVAAIPLSLRNRYLPRSVGDPDNTRRFSPRVRSMIEFEHMNLITTMPQGYRCSVIFCRNLMIYFDRPTQQRLVERLSHHLEDGGYLFIGHSEGLASISHGLEYVCPATYKKPGRLQESSNGSWR
ncbi:MAG TPA: protein-glutamate O-methyltransferase CheR [Acidobacteriaceae bacterium]|nr:protein-glutamate O-methyltransferase CheR [Acidobacteriaceae bacterium]